MALSLDDVKRTAELARIAIDESEGRAALAQLTRVFELIEEMRAVDVDAVEPMAHALDIVQPLRADAVTEADRHDEFQAIAPQVEADLYLVPKVIE